MKATLFATILTLFVGLNYGLLSISSNISVSSIIGVPLNPGAQYFWPQGRVPYIIDPSFDATDRSNLQAAIADYTAKTCIQWVPRSNEGSYVRFVRNRAGTGCAVSASCYYPNTVITSIFETCAEKGTMIHEMGHTICFGHEHERNDKDGFLQECPGGSKYNHLNFGHLYDYRSIMHYDCHSCMVPKMAGVGTYQCRSEDGLSVLDAEKINDMYNCLGCKGYRFRFPHMITTSSNPVAAGSENGETVYPCRAYYQGDILPGKAVVRNSVWACWVGYKGREYGFGNGETFEVLTNPTSSAANLRWTRATGGPIPANAIAGGRSVNGESIYVTRCRAVLGGVTQQILGKVYKNSPNAATYTYGGNEYTCTDYDLLVC